MKQQRLDDYSMFGLLKNLDEMDRYMQDLDLNKHLDELRCEICGPVTCDKSGNCELGAAVDRLYLCTFKCLGACW